MTTKAKTTEHMTGTAELLFMAAARPLTNVKSGKTEYSVKLKMQDSDPAVDHLCEVADYKVDTKTNRAQKDGTKIINFSSEFAPWVKSSTGETLEGDSIPFYDGRIDTGTVEVQYKVIDYGNNQIVRLSGIQLKSLNLAPREPREGTVNTLKNAVQSN